jgi:hypothetical protein
MLTQDFMLQCIEILGFKAPFTPRQSAARQYPLQFLCNFAYSVLDNKTGDLLKYCHLMKHPKYEKVWKKSFGTELRRLATMMKPYFSSRKMKYHENARATKIVHEYCVCIAMERRTRPACAYKWATIL